MLVSQRANFPWREGALRDLIPLLGDGLLTIDGAYHRTHRRMMLPAFHRERIAAPTTVMRGGGRARRSHGSCRARSSTSTTGRGDVALRVAHARALRIRSRPRAGRRLQRRRRVRVGAVLLRRATTCCRCCADRGTPFAAMQRSRAAPRRADLRGRSTRRRAGRARRGHPLAAPRRARRGRPTRCRRAQVRDEVMTLLFAGHDTTTSTVAFMFYELARNPELLDDPAIDDRDGSSTRRCASTRPRTSGRAASIEPFEFDGRAGARRRARQLLLVGEPPPPRRVRRSPERVPPAALHAERKARRAEGRLRPVRRRLAHVHRDALRPGRDRDHRARDPRALPARAAPGLPS